MRVEGRFLRQTGGRGFAARVTVDFTTNASSPTIRVDLSGEGWTRQGDLEDASSQGYGDWALGAEYGVAYALRVAGRTDCSVIVSRITGASTDTNPTVVAAAAADAVWKALQYTPPDS